jgi:ABC-type uncharacterized transport system permease subunit
VARVFGEKPLKLSHYYKMKYQLNYIKINFYLMIKELTEYKASFYSAFFVQLFFLPSFFLFVYVLSILFDEVITWTPIQIALFVLIEDTIRTLAGVFVWKKEYLSDTLTKGNLSLFISRPGGVAFKYFFQNLSPSAFSYVLVNIPFLLGIIFYVGIDFLSFLLFVIYSLLIMILYGSTYNLIYSLGHLIIHLEKSFFWLFYRVDALFVMYPAPFFKDFLYMKLFYIFPAFIIGSLIMPLFINSYSANLFQIVLLLILLILLQNILIYVIWKIGLKNYEAFG